jgi:hypothetical protein
MCYTFFGKLFKTIEFFLDMIEPVLLILFCGQTSMTPDSMLGDRQDERSGQGPSRRETGSVKPALKPETKS